MKKSDVLVSLLKDDQVPMVTLHKRYKPVLELVKILIGVIPNCDGYLEIWPPAFRSYNIMVPNLLNLPFGVFGLGGAPKDLVGLSLYVSSLSADCPYCTAHTCSYAMRRGTSPEKLAKSLLGGEDFTEQELATISIARSLSTIPSQITDAEREALASAFKPKDAEWIVMGAVNMGFLNKFMDALSVELEPSTMAETAAIMGHSWSPGKAGIDLKDPTARTRPPKSDSLMTKLSVLKYAPKAIKMDKEWQKGVPDSYPEIGQFLLEKTGYSFPVLSRVLNKRVPRAIAAMLIENLDSNTTVIGLKTKILSGIIFAHRIFSPELIDIMKVIGLHFGLTNEEFEKSIQFTLDDNVDQVSDDSKVKASMLLVKAAAPSPAEITEDVVSICRDSKLSPPQIVELITWISILQMLYRLKSYYN